MDTPDPCRWCLSARVIVMIGEEESGIVLCPHCDYARSMAAGPPIDPGPKP